MGRSDLKSVAGGSAHHFAWVLMSRSRENGLQRDSAILGTRLRDASPVDALPLLAILQQNRRAS